MTCMVPVVCVVFLLLGSLSLHAENIDDTIRITSNRQVITQDQYVFTDDVEIVVKGLYHILADTVRVDTVKSSFTADSNQAFGVKVESEKVLLFARSFTYDSLSETGTAHDAIIHLYKGYITAESVERQGDGVWYLKDALYTPCDAAKPHWRLTAGSVQFHDDILDASNASFLIGDCPVAYLPRIAMPLQGKSKSGLLIPQLSFHYHHGGIGIQQDYYWYLHPHADCTAGIDWQQQRGFFITSKARSARSLEDYTIATGYVGRAWDMFVQREGAIVQESRNRYWLQGKDFRNLGKINDLETYSLTQADCGSDKKMGYQFFDSVDDVDDTFFNSCVVRGYYEGGVLDFRIDGVTTSRKRFSLLNNVDRVTMQRLFAVAYPDPNEREAVASGIAQKALINRFAVARLPHIEYNSQYAYLANLASYRHDVFADYLTYGEYETEQLYAVSRLMIEDPLIPRKSADMMRFEYRGVVREHVQWLNQSLTLACYPHYQVRSNVLTRNYPNTNVIERRFTANGAQRAFLEYAAEWCLPEVQFYADSNNYRHYVQPVVTWGLLPKFCQRNWYFIDKWDRWYPKHEIACSVRHNISLGDAEIDWSLSQAYDFYNNNDLLPLRRSVSGQHLLPMRNYFALSRPGMSISCEQEYDFSTGRFLASEVNASWTVRKLQLGVSYLFGDWQALERKKLLSNIPHFLFFYCAIPLNKHATLQYGGQFYAEKGASMQPLIHQVKFEYDGHCWGFYLGVEAKIYREDGRAKQDRAIVFSMHFDSLGTVGKKFKAPYFPG